MFHREMPDYPADLSLSSRSLYSYELNFVPFRHLYSNEYDRLVDRARQGDEQAREEMILLCLRHVAKVAHTFYQTLDHGKDDLSDLIALGNLALVERLDYALTKDQPFPVLYGAAESEIRVHCRYHSDLIDLPEHSYIVDRGPTMMSLDEPVEDGYYSEIVDQYLASATLSGISQKNFLVDALDGALDTVLTPIEREVVQLKYGLRDGQEPLPHHAIARKMGIGQTSSQRYHWRAISKLRRHMLVS
jgi:RNA polymerase sigma factor (sigma-70 family)